MNKKSGIISTRQVFSAFRPAGDKETRDEIREAIVDYELCLSKDDLVEEIFNQILEEEETNGRTIGFR
ncbi:MAG: hypothetical protein ACLFO6_03905 [Archaeoglobaceae archaeon]